MRRETTTQQHYTTAQNTAQHNTRQTYKHTHTIPHTRTQFVLHETGVLDIGLGSERLGLLHSELDSVGQHIYLDDLILIHEQRRQHRDQHLGGLHLAEEVRLLLFVFVLRPVESSLQQPKNTRISTVQSGHSPMEKH